MLGIVGGDGFRPGRILLPQNPFPAGLGQSWLGEEKRFLHRDPDEDSYNLQSDTGVSRESAEFARCAGIGLGIFSRLEDR